MIAKYVPLLCGLILQLPTAAAGEGSEHSAGKPATQSGELRPPRLGDEMTESVLGIQFVYIPRGSFVMGSPESEPNRYPDERQHEVTINTGFWMGKYEVTFKQYDAFCKATHHARAFDEGWGRGQRPVINIKWFEAVEFARWLSNKSGHHYRLPSEAEWEYAARAGTKTAYSWGDNPADFTTYAWNTSNSPYGTKRVRTKLPNPWGLYDMHGNAWEWVQDWLGTYPEDAQVDPIGPETGTLRVVRGGVFMQPPPAQRSAYRFGGAPFFPDGAVGVRLVRQEPEDL